MTENEGILDTVENITGVDQPYKQYVDEWNEGILEDLVEAEVMSWQQLRVQRTSQ